MTITAGPTPARFYVTQPTNGSVTFNSSTVTYVLSGPALEDSFTYLIGDGHGGKGTGTVSVVVFSPLLLRAADDFAVTDQDTPVKIRVLDNDSPAGLVSIVSFGHSALRGSVGRNADKTLTYYPAGRFDHLQLGETNYDSFKYWITDGVSGNSTGTVTVAVSGLNDPPVVQPLQINRFPGTNIVKISQAILLAGAHDVDDGDVVSLAGFFAFSDNGSAIDVSASELISAPAVPLGVDTLQYLVSDSYGATVTNQLTISVVTPGNFVLEILPESHDFALGFSGTPGRNYRVQYKTNLTDGAWQELGPTAEGVPGFFYYLDAAPGGTTRYYRVTGP